MAVVFLEGRLSPIPMQMASTKLYRDPRRGVCQSAIVEGENVQKMGLLTAICCGILPYLASRDTARLTTIKNNNDICRKLTIAKAR
jgi:hypothetical protein